MTILPTLSVAIPRDGLQPEAEARPPTLRAASFIYEPDDGPRIVWAPLAILAVSSAIWTPIGLLIWNWLL